MKNKNKFICLIFCLLTLTGCLPASENLKTPELTSNVTPTKVYLTQTDGVVIPVPSIKTQVNETYIFTIATSDDEGSHIYDLSIGCFDAIPCVETTRKLFDTAWLIYELNWSPDGRTLAFTSEKDKENDIFVTSDEGKTLINITNVQKPDENHPSHPNWSHDGQKIAYSIGSSVEETKIFVLSLASGKVDQILPNVFEPSEFLWLHQGMTAYSSSVDYVHQQIQVLNQDGSLYWLIPLDESKKSFEVHGMILSPNGKYLAYGGFGDNQARLYLANLQNKSIEALPSVDKFCNDLKGSWSPDSKWLVFRSNCDSADFYEYKLYLFNLAQQKRIELKNLTTVGDIVSITWRPNRK